MNVTVSTDGSALSNPHGPMGWAWVNHAGASTSEREHDCGGASNGTNQIGELCAVLQALRHFHDADALLIETDSQYAINCSTTWVHNWKRNGWKNAAKKPVKNVELIKAIDFEMTHRPGPVRFKWVKGHAGEEFNEQVDDLARGFATRAGAGAVEGYLPIEGWQSLLNSEYARGLDVPPSVTEQLSGANAGAVSEATDTLF
jgi:ribonuclease HI